MIGELRFVLKVLSSVEDEAGIDIRQLHVEDDVGVVRVSLEGILPPERGEALRKAKKILSDSFDNYGIVLRGDGNIIIRGYILTGKTVEPLNIGVRQ